MVSDFTVVLFQQLDGIFAHTVGRMDMEKLSILIPLDGNTKFAALLPISDFFHDCEFKGIDRQGAQVCFSPAKRSLFLEEVESINDGFAIALALPMGADAADPEFTFLTVFF